MDCSAHRLLPSPSNVTSDAVFPLLGRRTLMLLEIQSLATSKVFKVNGHRLKPFYEGFQVENVEKLDLEDPSYTD
ncbi:hypothetical protein AAC387_Pa05g0079 [Persea americana]